jgi:hypothetical protein
MDEHWMKRKHKHFLIMEENPDDAFILMRAFRAVPLCSAYVARNIREARAYLSGAGIYEDRVNFPFPDGMLIGFRTGRSAVEEIGSLAEQIQTLPSFVLTGGASPKEIDFITGLGIKEVIQKPSSLEALRELVHRLVQDICAETPPTSPDIGQ